MNEAPSIAQQICAPGAERQPSPPSTQQYRGVIHLRRLCLEWGTRTYVMGIVNVTPDSFSDDGVVSRHDAVRRALYQLGCGAHMIDIGGESTRPGYEPVSTEVELARVIPVIEDLRKITDAVISIDTQKTEVLQRAAQAGADVLNSVGPLHADRLNCVIENNMAMVIMHNQASPAYDTDVVDEVVRYLDAGAHAAVNMGLDPRKVILDPGIGFGKLPEHNVRILRNLNRIVGLGFPTLIGSSRKSTIGKLTGRSVENRRFGTAATVALAIEQGIDIVRVHDVAEMVDVARVCDAVVRGWRPDAWEVDNQM